MWVHITNRSYVYYIFLRLSDLTTVVLQIGQAQLVPGHIVPPDDEDEDIDGMGSSPLETVNHSVAPLPPAQTVPIARTIPKINWRVPSSLDPSSTAPPARPSVPVIQIQGVQRSQEQHMADGQLNEEDVSFARQQQQNGGE